MKNIFIVLGVLIIIGVLAFALFKETPSTYDDHHVDDEMHESDGHEDEDSHENDEMEGMMEESSSDTSDEQNSGDSATVKSFTVDSFSFGYSMEEIVVNEGDTVTINLTNSDGFHDWVVDEFGAATEKIKEGGETSVTFVADKAGTYEYYCSVGSHRANGMVGTLVVQ